MRPRSTTTTHHHLHRNEGSSKRLCCCRARQMIGMILVLSFVVSTILYSPGVMAFTIETGVYRPSTSAIRPRFDETMIRFDCAELQVPHKGKETRSIALHTSLFSSSSSKIPLFNDRNESINLKEETPTKNFLEYMFRRKGCQGETDAFKILVDESTGYRGMYVSSKEGIQKGDYIFAVPFSSTWIVESEEDDDDENENDNDTTSTSTTMREELSDAERGLRFLNWLQEQEQIEKNSNDWKPYLDMLPSRNNSQLFDPTPDFWSNEEIRALELPPIVERALEKKKSVQDLSASISANSYNGNTLDEGDLRFATWLINSRAITVILQNGDDEEEDDYEETEGEDTSDIHYHGDDDDDDEEEDYYDESFTTTCVLVPLLDMINHSSEKPNAYFSVLGDESEESKEYDHDEQLFYAAIADRDLKEDEEIFISYGNEQYSSLDLLLQYGFIPSENPFDVDFWNSISSEVATATGTGDEEEKDVDAKMADLRNCLDASCWSTTLEKDLDRWNELVTTASRKDEEDWSAREQRSVAIERTTLDFRIRMKRVFADWKRS
mmetsp:Transcript_6968/g.14827  ORF Transcript_6968/g.14827 Transcript_6968/m.14827 type:complete len:552 (-) Transcript_6968:371-2026(-)